MIEIRQLTKQYGSFVAVDNLTLDIHKGETFALLGPNGSGKSTTLRCLAGLSRPSRGVIAIEGMDVVKHPLEARRLMSYLPQRANFPENLSAREILEFYGRLRKVPSARVEELLSASRFEFNGFENKPVGEFSGGMMQRLGLAVACLPDAPLLVLDEPTVGLDPNGAIQFRRFLEDLKSQGKTIVFASHMLDDVEQLADRVAILVSGKLVALESIEALRQGMIRHCRMRVFLSNPGQRWVDVALHAGAQTALVQGESLLITSIPEHRFQILKALESAGSQIAQFATEDLALEDMLLSYIHGESTK